MAIQIRHLSKAFDSKPVLADFSAEIPENAVTCLMGESGCGKTTLLSPACRPNIARRRRNKRHFREKSPCVSENRLAKILRCTAPKNGL